MTKVLRFFLFIFLVGLAFSCSSPEGGGEEAADVPGVTDEEIVLGSWGPLTGPAALWGAVPQGMDAYFSMINEEGGIHGRKIRFIYKDDAYDPSRTVPAVREMVQKDNVFAFVGGVGTAPNMAVKDFIVEEGIPWVSPASGATHWAHPPVKNIFSIFPLYFDEAEVQVNYAVDELGASKIAIIYQNDDFGKSALVSAQNALKAHDLELVAEVSTEVLDSDLSSHAARLQKSGAEVVLLWTLPRQAAIILGTTAVSGYKPQWIASLVLSDMGLMHNITKGAWEGVIFGFFGILPSDTTKTTRSKYRQALAKHKHDLRWGAFSASGFAYAEPLVEGLKRAGKDLTRESFIAAMESIQDWQGTSAKISFGPDNRQGHRSMYLVKCISGTEAEVLSDYMEGTADVEMLKSQLEYQ